MTGLRMKSRTFHSTEIGYIAICLREKTTRRRVRSTVLRPLEMIESVDMMRRIQSILSEFRLIEPSQSNQNNVR